MVAPAWVVQHPHSARERGATNRAHGIFKGRHFEATLILQAVSWYPRYPLSYRDIEELFLERGLEVDHSTLNRWVLAYAPLIERRLRTLRKPHCGSIRVNETYIKVRGQWRYLYRPSTSTAPRSTSSSRRSATWTRLNASSARRCKTSRCSPPTGSAPMVRAPTHPRSQRAGLLARTPLHSVTKHLQQGIESDHFRVKRPMPRV